MKRLLPAIILILVALGAAYSTAQIAGTSSALNDYVNVRSYPTITAAHSAAVTQGRGLLVSTNVNISTAVTLTVPVSVVKGGGFTKVGSGTLSLPAAFTAADHKIFTSFTSSVSFTTGAVLSPMWWGAKGDGTTDDQPAVQAALNAIQASGGGHLHFPRGSYRMQSLWNAFQALALDFTAAQNTSPVVLTGDGARLVTHPTNSDVLLLNLAGSTGNGYLQDLTVQGLTFVGARTPTDDDVNVTQNHLLYLTYVENAKVTGNTFKNTGGAGIYGYVKKAIVSNNHFLDANGGAQFGLANHLTVSKNQFICTRKADDQIAVFGGPVFGTSANIDISDNMIDKGYDGLKGVGGTRRGWGRGITIGDGVMNVRLAGNDLKNINTSSPLDENGSFAHGGIYIENSAGTVTGVEITGNTIRNSRWGILIRDLVAGGLTLADNTISDMEHHGIIATSTSLDSKASPLTLKGNRLRSIGTGSQTEQDRGIHVSGYDDVSVASNELSGLNTSYAMLISMPGNTLRMNDLRVKNNGVTCVTAPTNTTTSYGIYISGSDSSLVSSNTVSCMTQYGLRINSTASSRHVIENNTFDNFTGGVPVYYDTANPIVYSMGNWHRPFGATGNPESAATTTITSAPSYTGQLAVTGPYAAHVATGISSSLNWRPITGSWYTQATPSTSTTATGTTTLWSTTIPGGSFGKKGTLTMTTLWSVTASTWAKTISAIYGGTQIMANGVSGATIPTVKSHSIFFNDNSESSQIILTNSTAWGAGSVAITPGSINTAVDKTLTVSCSVVLAGEVCTLRGVLLHGTYSE